MQNDRHSRIEKLLSNGTRRFPDDLLFSMIKQSWPEAQNIVYQLQQRVGSLMQPTDYMMTAFRLASLQSNASKLDDPELNARAFHRRIADIHNGHVWNDECLLAFQSAVESRVIYLYQQFFNELDFSAWTKL